MKNSNFNDNVLTIAVGVVVGIAVAQLLNKTAEIIVSITYPMLFPERSARQEQYKINQEQQKNTKC